MQSGLVVVDKPAGWTSHDVVARVRKCFGQKRVGHAGTLDPDATGVLLVGLGRVTRLMRFLQETEKEYRGEVVFGIATSTLDAAGEVLDQRPLPVTREQVEQATAGFIGDIDQVPPMVSALKVGGRRLHEMARAGEEIERAPRRVHISQIDVEEFIPGAYPVATVRVVCGSGTYIRSLAADLGAALGGPAHLGSLRRLRVGAFTTDDAHDLDAIAADPPATLLSPRVAMRGLEEFVIDEDQARAVSHGMTFPATVADAAGLGDGPFAVVGPDDDLLAVYERRGAAMRPAVVIAASEGGIVKVVPLEDFTPSDWGAAVTIGAYDGVHLGHQAVLRFVREIADARGHESVCLTFDRHPAEVVRPESAPKQLTSLEQKVELLDATGYLDRTAILTFDESRSREPAEDFVREVLVSTLGARIVIVGADFHFGYRRHGTVRLLEQMGAELGFAVLGLGLVPIEGEASGLPYSSTEIRRLLSEGRVRDASRLYANPPRFHEVRGVVEMGDQRGRELGFPTANVAVPQRMCLPADGIYAGTFIGVDGVERPSAISLGRRPTFYEAAEKSLLEVHLLDFEGDLYGQEVAVRFVEHLRGEVRYDSVDALVEQIQRDCDAARKILASP